MVQIKVETTTLSSRGQVVLPQDVRERLNLKEGDKFLVMAEEDTVILKAIKPIPKEKFESMLEATREAVKKAGITPEDLNRTIERVRHARSS
jgi:AbrB family looped-hinge helix DNA binding protein